MPASAERYDPRPRRIQYVPMPRRRPAGFLRAEKRYIDNTPAACIAGIPEVLEVVFRSIQDSRRSDAVDRSHEAAVTITAPPTSRDVVLQYLGQLNSIMVVSQVQVRPVADGAELAVEVNSASGG